MELSRKKQLIDLNNNFYRQVAPAFSSTRQNSWAGWEKLILPKSSDFILDVAAGNLRFKKFLDGKVNNLQYLGLDACAPLLELNHDQSLDFAVVDFLASFLENKDWQQNLPRTNFNYVFCSAFFHHIPGSDWRENFLQQLWSLVAPNGYLVISLWQFMLDPNLSKRILEDLGNHDYLLSWKKDIVATRYCHHFDDQEIDCFINQIELLGGKLIKRFNADGATHKMNCYLIWQK